MAKKICIFTASTLTRSPKLRGIITSFATQLAHRNYHLIMGGMSTGNMELAGKTFLNAGGHATIIYPDDYAHRQRELQHPNLTHIPVPDITQRVGLMYTMTDASVTFPGGIGTLHELAQMDADNQAGTCNLQARTPKPHVKFNYKGFYRGTIIQHKRCYTAGYIPDKHMQLLKFTNNWEDILPMLEAALPHAT